MANSISSKNFGDISVPLSILDFAMAGKGSSARQALAASIELAKLADRRGFHRYWVAEHHSLPGVTTSSPALMLARLIGETQRIRLGAGGMMLPNFLPLVIAEQFGLLTALAPERIDLGIGRAPGTDIETATALRRGQIDKEDFPRQLKELLCFLDDSFPKKASYSANVYAVPGPRQDLENGIARSFKRPPVWLLGSSTYSARIAAERGFPFAFAAHLADENLEMAVEIYCKNFRPSKVLAEPYVIASFGVMAAENPVEAKRQAWSYAHAMMRMVTRRSFVVPTPDEAENYDYTPTELRLMHRWDRKIIKGTGQQVIVQLNEWQQRIHINELVVINLGHTPAAIYHSTKLIADAYGLPHNVLD
ncbi:LLM class flavin-dependent oxidoreductase [Acinetobacter radioresistens]|uniref:LLM class flavin-dependent oxidoreductase n=1 Tax=Acinetobacter radioresistens TaxID=40216 RepID=UPI000946856B|nr:LLM class flavin-dependent oxidoreductase [Acinetobacter radioresistens]